MKKLPAILSAAAIFFCGYALGSRGIRELSRAAFEITQAPQEGYAASLLEIDLGSLRAVNPDVMGWIVIPDTSLSYPLLRGGDNEYYLSRSWQGEPDPAGSIFMDTADSTDLSGFNTRIYGHRMSRDAMFNSLRHYADGDYLAAHPKVYLVTEEGVRVYRVFAACEVDTTAPVYWTGELGAEYRQDVIDFCMKNSAVSSGVIPSATGRILTLSTCTGLLPSDRRWVVIAAETELILR